MHRVATVIGYAADWGVFGIAIGAVSASLFDMHLLGFTVSDLGTASAGIGALLVGLGRALKYAADARMSNAQARQVEIENKHRLHTLHTIIDDEPDN